MASEPQDAATLHPPVAPRQGFGHAAKNVPVITHGSSQSIEGTSDESTKLHEHGPHALMHEPGNAAD